MGADCLRCTEQIGKIFVRFFFDMEELAAPTQSLDLNPIKRHQDNLNEASEPGPLLFKCNKRMSDADGGSQSVAGGRGRGEGVRAEQGGS